MKFRKKKEVVEEIENPEAVGQDVSNEEDIMLNADGEFDEAKFRIKWTKIRKQRALRLAFTLIMLAGIATGMYFIFRAFGIDVNPFLSEAERAAMRDEMHWAATGFTLVLIFWGIYLLQSTFLNMIPGTTTVFITVVAASMFPMNENILLTIGVAIGAVLICAVNLYCIGRFGGRRVLYWLFDKDKLDKKLDWFARNGTKGVPWLFLIPFFPTDMICLACGMSKMKFWHFMLVVIIFRPVEVALLLVYRLIFPFFTGLEDPLQQLLLINVIIINIVLLVSYHKAILKLFNRAFRFRRYEEDLAAAKAAVLAATQPKVVLVEEVVCEICDDIEPVVMPKNTTKKPRIRSTANK